MHELIERGLAKEVHGPQCISYILEDDSLFNLSEYKIIHNQGTEKFLESVKSTYNGKIKLTYFLDEHVSLKSLAGAIEVYPFVSVLANALTSVLEVNGNGYLDLCDLMLDLNRIFVNPTSLDVKLIYLPINSQLNRGTSLLANSPVDELRAGLVRLISSTPALQSAKTREISAWLSDSSMSLADICARIRMEMPGQQKKMLPVNIAKNSVLVIRSTNPRDFAEFRINSDSFVIGRNPNEADGYIGFNPAISSRHCIIYKTQFDYEIEDISKNGTYINNIRINSGVRSKLKDGDVLRLANSNFSVSIVEG